MFYILMFIIPNRCYKNLYDFYYIIKTQFFWNYKLNMLWSFYIWDKKIFNLASRWTSVLTNENTVYEIMRMSWWSVAGNKGLYDLYCFIGGGNWNTQRKPLACHKSLTCLIKYCIEYTSPWMQSFLNSSDLFDLGGRKSWGSPITSVMPVPMSAKHFWMMCLHF
jgi:hypothetical protein